MWVHTGDHDGLVAEYKTSEQKVLGSIPTSAK